MRIGGLLLNILKKLKGARLAWSFSSTVETQAMGRGPIAPKRRPCLSLILNSLGSIDLIVMLLMAKGNLSLLIMGLFSEN